MVRVNFNTIPFILVVNYLIQIKSHYKRCRSVTNTVTTGFEAIIKRATPALPHPPEFLQFFKIKYLLCLSR
jgi:hypothetical protein